MRHLELAVVAGLLAVALLLGALWLGFPLWLWVLVYALLAALLGWAWPVIGRNARSWGYAERDEDLYIKHGVLFRRLVVVPYGRMQFVDVHAGPLENAYGIAAVHLHTASPSSDAHIPGLPRDEAARLRDRLTSLGEAQAAGL
jgi:membrane protein YdbS with pleckstrin-like domain